MTPCAALLFGLAEETRVRAQVDGALATLQTALGPVNFAEAFAAGRQMGMEEAFAAIPIPNQPPASLWRR